MSLFSISAVPAISKLSSKWVVRRNTFSPCVCSLWGNYEDNDNSKTEVWIVWTTISCVRGILAACVRMNGPNKCRRCMQPILTLIHLHNMDSATQVVIQLSDCFERIGKVRVCVSALRSHYFLIVKSLNFYGTRKSITVFTTARHWARWTHPTSRYTAFLRHIVIL
jgi:hypothetical protein